MTNRKGPGRRSQPGASGRVSPVPVAGRVKLGAIGSAVLVSGGVVGLAFCKSGDCVDGASDASTTTILERTGLGFTTEPYTMWITGESSPVSGAPSSAFAA